MSETSPAGEADSSTDVYDKDLLVCFECDKDYSSRNGLRYHLNQYHPESVVDCPKCDKAFLSDTGMKMHHSRTHGASIAGEVTTCERCGDEYRATADTRGVYCSRECNKQAESEYHASNRPTVKCDRCGELFEVKPHRKDTATYCSHECRRNQVQLTCSWCGDEYVVIGSREDTSEYCSIRCLWFEIANSQESNPEILECKQCKDEYPVKPSHAKNSRFCSQDCKAEWQSKHLVGEDHPRWKGGYDPYYGPNWRKQRRKALKRDQYRCQGCSKTAADLRREPSVHHIRRVMWFKDNLGEEWYDKANEPQNLVTLCQSCHSKWEGIPLKPALLPTE